MITYEDRLRNALRAQHQRWFDYDLNNIRSEFAEYIDCPVCGSNRSSEYMEKDYFRFYRCDDCSMVFLNPRLNVDATYSFYNSEWTAIYNETKFIGNSQSVEIDNRINHANINLLKSYLSKTNGSKSSLLEIGIGSGFFLQAAQEEGFEVHGIDVDASNIERARDRFGERIVNKDIYEAHYPDQKFDVVYMRDVFEHVPNPGLMLKEINRISRPDALIYIEVPNIQGLIYRVVGSRHVCVFGFAHLNYWSPASITNALTLAGYEVLDIVHESLDCTLAEMARYYRGSSFTSVFPQPVGNLKYLLLTAVYAFLRLPIVTWLDRSLFPTLANKLKLGSVLKVVGRKSV